MKITIEGTLQDKGKIVSIEVPDDDLSLFDGIKTTVVVDLIKPALLAWGYNKTTVEEFFGE